VYHVKKKRPKSEVQVKNEEAEQNRTLTAYQIRNIRLLTHLLKHNAVDDEIVDELRESELEFFTLTEKCRLLEKRINLDEKTSLLKYRKSYLTTIIKTASRIYSSIKSRDFVVVIVRFDIDNFSQFNTIHGHNNGDKILRLISQILRDHSRPTDYIIRYGGEEFDALLPGTDLTGALAYIDRVFEFVRKSTIEIKGKSVGVTISAGVTFMKYTFRKDDIVSNDEIEKLYVKIQDEADDALYEAKYLGKDRYCIYDVLKKKDYSLFRESYNKSQALSTRK
jgi:diguanylate cyclase (GGDEF)-like protein